MCVLCKLAVYIFTVNFFYTCLCVFRLMPTLHVCRDSEKGAVSHICNENAQIRKRFHLMSTCFFFLIRDKQNVIHKKKRFFMFFNIFCISLLFLFLCILCFIYLIIFCVKIYIFLTHIFNIFVVVSSDECQHKQLINVQCKLQTTLS